MAIAKILVVDDEPFNVDFLEQELAESDYETISASNGQEALDLIQFEKPDLVLLDIMMPKMDGFEVLSRIKADPATRDIPVIVISASSNLQNIAHGISLGAEDYLPKPFEPVLLHARISSSLDKKHLRDLQQLYLKSLERELEIGREIQKDFLPHELPQVEGWEIAACFEAAHEVAGDFYDTFLLPDKNLMVVVGDVCGKGVGAALYMTLFRSLIHATATTDTFRTSQASQHLSPAERLHHVISFTNNYLVENHEDANMFATVFIGMIEINKGTLKYINCGNEPPCLIKSSGTIVTLPPTSPVVGVISEAVFSVKELEIGPDDALLAFTDGVLDAIDRNNEPFGLSRLLEICRGGHSSAQNLVDIIEGQIHLHIGKADQFDDITMLTIKRIRKYPNIPPSG